MPIDPPMPFSNWLMTHRHGEADEEWAESLAEVLEACRLTGKKGSVTIKIDIAPKGATVVVVDTVEVKAPKPDREAAVYFVDGTFSLVRHNPAQVRAEEHESPDGTRDFRVIGPGGEVLDIPNDERGRG